MESSGKLTVFFEEPFWVGVYERRSGKKLEAARVVFGAEPKDYEVYEFFLKNWSRLSFSPPVEGERAAPETGNPKRMQREARRTLTQSGTGTKAQQALQLLREANAQERKVRTREQRDAEAERKFELRQQKRKEKHRGK
jgi:hypothetical protein